MSFLWLADKPLRTREQIAREVHAVSLARGLDELATVLTLMCISTEVGANDKAGQRQWWCPWNAADPQTKQFDHDSQSDDSLSSGYLQQQVSRPGAPGQPWGWGGLFGDLNGARKRMTLATAADMFQAALADDYRRAAGNPRLAGEFVQRVQRSAFPDRYAEKWDEAWTVLRRALSTAPPPQAAPQGQRFWPMRTGAYTLSSPFGPRGGSMHYGTDFAAKDGTPIYAAAAGTVAHIGAASGFGQWIVLQHDGFSTVYGHMWNAAATGLRQGDRVAGGKLIALVGNNGQSTGAHLHFEVHPGAWRAGSQIDPLPWLAGAAQPGPPPLSLAPVAGPWTGDPVWLADVLRAEGLRVVEYPGWRDRGHGDFKDIRGVMVHHTGSDTATAASIATGRPDLAGPLSQIHIARDGTVTLVAVGVAWHAGKGSYPWLPTDLGNWHLIGIEAANSGTSTTAAHRTNWPDAQYDAIVRCCAAINRRLAQNSSRTIGHKEYAGRAQGKWDPGAIDMGVLRADIQRQIDSTAGEDELSAEAESMIKEIRDALLEPVDSASPYAEPGEGKKWRRVDFLRNGDGMTHGGRIETQARRGHPGALRSLVRTARGEGKYRDADTVNDAIAVLAEIDGTTVDDIKQRLQKG